MLTHSAPIAIHKNIDGREYSETGFIHVHTPSLLTTNGILPLLLLLLATQFLPLLLHSQRLALEGLAIHTILGPKRARIRRKLDVQLLTSVHPIFRRSLDVQPTSKFDVQRANLDVLRMPN